MLKILSLVLAGFAALHPAPAAAQEPWPARPIRLVVPSAAGSGVDLVARRIGDRVSRQLGQPLVVENKAGAGGGIAAEYVARSAPDGYTFLVATSAPLVLTPLLSKSMRYDADKDFMAVGRILASPYLIVANKKMPFNTVAELVAYDKAHPGKLSFASDGIKNLGGLTGEMFNRMAGTKIVQVPYTSTARALQDTVAGQTQLTFMGTQLTVDAIRSGDVKALGITTPRVQILPEVASIAESVPGFEVTGWMLVVAPRGVPRPIVERMNAAISQALQDPDWIRDQQKTTGYLWKDAGVPAEVDHFLDKERAKWGGLVKLLNIQPE
jgi:tripartite-type tricarboxylate transporter receptor subunit TctC